MQKPKRVYDRVYLEGFGRSFNKYKRTVTHNDGTKAVVPDWDEIYFRAGVKTKRGAVTWYLDNGVRKFLIDKFEEVYRQWQAMVDGKDWAEEKKLEQLDQTIGEINAEKAFGEY